jgi:hypothetical protein
MKEALTAKSSSFRASPFNPECDEAGFQNPPSVMSDTSGGYPGMDE